MLRATELQDDGAAITRADGRSAARSWGSNGVCVRDASSTESLALPLTNCVDDLECSIRTSDHAIDTEITQTTDTFNQLVNR